MGIWSEYFLKSPKRELVLGEKLWKIFIRPIPSRKAGKFGRIHAKSAIGRLVVGRDEAQQAICPRKPRANAIFGSRASQPDPITQFKRRNPSWRLLAH